MLDPFVDKFVIQEFGETFSGKAKPRRLNLNDQLFSSIDISKIVLIQQDRFPDGLKPFEKEWFQRDSATSWLHDNLKNGDWVLYGDVDEIPNPKVLAQFSSSGTEVSRVPHFLAMRMSYGYLNFFESTGRLLSNLGEFSSTPKKHRRWLGGVIWPEELLRRTALSRLRSGESVDVETGIRVPNGGWHFSYVDGLAGSALDRFEEKLSESAHQEFNNKRTISRIASRISRGRDPLGRRFVRFTCENPSELPIELQKFASKRPDMLLDCERLASWRRSYKVKREGK